MAKSKVKKDRTGDSNRKKNQISKAYDTFDLLKGKDVLKLNESETKEFLSAIGKILRVVDPSGKIIGRND